VDKIRNLFVRSRESEAQFIVRALQKKMRLNMGEKTLLVALAHTFLHRECKSPSVEKKQKAAEMLSTVYRSILTPFLSFSHIPVKRVTKLA